MSMMCVMKRLRFAGLAMILAILASSWGMASADTIGTAKSPERKATKSKPATSNSKQTKATKAKPRTNPAFEAPEHVSGLPNVLLIGDSISIGYTLGVRERLAGTANVYRPPTNCGPTTRGLAYLDSWLARPTEWSEEEQWDVIHFNFGLHDLKYMDSEGNLVKGADFSAGKMQVPIDEYRKNIRGIASKLKDAGACVIWRETSPVPEGARGRKVGDSKRYNEVALEVMAELGGFKVDPFFSYCRSIADLQRPADVHYTPAGTSAQSDHVAEVVNAALAKE